MSRTATWVSADRSIFMEHHDRVLFFDGVCNLCNSLVRFIIRHDHRVRIRFSPLQSEFAVKIPCNPGFTRPDSVIYFTEGKCFIKSSAILKMFRDMGGGWKLLYAFIVVPRFLRDFFYDLIARNRYRIFGKRDSCMIPTTEIRERFL